MYKYAIIEDGRVVCTLTADNVEDALGMVEGRGVLYALVDDRWDDWDEWDEVIRNAGG